MSWFVYEFKIRLRKTYVCTLLLIVKWDNATSQQNSLNLIVFCNIPSTTLKKLNNYVFLEDT